MKSRVRFVVAAAVIVVCAVTCGAGMALVTGDEGNGEVGVIGKTSGQLRSHNPHLRLTVACCFDDGTCEDMYRCTCVALGGHPQGAGSSCVTTECDIPEQTIACCFDDDTCVDLPGWDCWAQGGHPQGPDTSCETTVCEAPFDTVAWIVREALRVLAPGGLLLFETPNTRNVLVGATTFHTDPTHLKPMPEQVMGVLFETAGFYPVDIRHLNAHERFDEFRAKPDFNDELAFLMFGPQDLAVLGSKPQDKE